MAARVHDYIASGEEAAKILLDLIHTPMLRRLHFVFNAQLGEVPMVDYDVERLAYAEKTIVEPVLDEHGNQTGEFKKVKAADY